METRDERSATVKLVVPNHEFAWSREERFEWPSGKWGRWVIEKRADFDESGQRFQQVADKHFAKSRTAGSIDFRQPGCCQG
ncbi:hypothetical protein [Rhizobium wenxiniae]|uniref:hypothetical protein n=1 Tax=Rhizobium wenxiniae TaxID=1737357 RepID=UPI001C6F32D4|nr:hypothetical protein [Rhizobium wenxiniae]